MLQTSLGFERRLRQGRNAYENEMRNRLSKKDFAENYENCWATVIQQSIAESKVIAYRSVTKGSD